MIEGAPLVVVPESEVLTIASLRRWTDGLSSTHPQAARVWVATRRIDLPQTWRAELASNATVTLLRIRDDFDNDAVAAVEGAAVCEVPEIALAWVVDEEDGASGALELQRYAFGDLQRLPESLRSAASQGTALVDAWSVTWQPTPLLRGRTDVTFQRTHQRRDLPTRTESRSLGSDGRHAVLVKLVDVFHQHTSVELTMGAPGRGQPVTILTARYV